jgi:hypothetical protein
VDAPGSAQSAVFLLSCVAQKCNVPTKAKDLYISDWFVKARTFVEGTGLPWFILSAEHGLIAPKDAIAPYERTLNTMGVAERRAWAERVERQMDASLPPVEQIIVFAGERYREFLMPYLRRRARRVIVPLEGL